jgi:CRISPR-associated protein Cst2
MREVKMLTGVVLINAPLSALNNAGIEPGRYAENKVVVKKISVRGKGAYPYVSGQAFKRWWRDTVHEKFGWTPSEIWREEKVAYTEADPIKCEEDDVFGYMLAPREKLEDVGMVGGLVYRRIAPLKVSPLISLFPNVIGSDFGIFGRGAEAEAEPVPYEQEHYSTVLKGAFSLMLNEIGVFALGRAKDLPKTTDADEVLRRKERDEKIEKLVNGFKQRVNRLRKEAEIRQATIDDDNCLITMPEVERKKRVKEIVRALGELRGGAKLSGYLTDVAPKFVVAAVIRCANHIFMDIVKESDSGIVLDASTLTEIVNDYHNEFLSPIFVGLRRGFLDEAEYERISKMKEVVFKTTQGQGKLEVKFGTPKQALEAMAEFIETIKL